MIDQIKQWFVQAVPEPDDKNRAVQVGCHLEESAEMASALGEEELADQLDAWAEEHKMCYVYPEKSYFIDRIELLDSLCDQIVTAIGVAHMFGMDIEGALVEVNRSNWSKFVDGKPQFDVNGKIAKPASYSKPDLKKFV